MKSEYSHNDCMPLSLASTHLGGDPVDGVEEDQDTQEDDTEDKVDAEHTVGCLPMFCRL